MTRIETGVGLVVGRGWVPRAICEARAADGLPYIAVAFAGAVPDWLDDHPHRVVPFEKPGQIFDAFHDANCSHVCFIGGLDRPSLNPLKFDKRLMSWAPKLLPALKSGDDGLLRLLAGYFEAEGFTMVAADALLPDLLVGEGVLTRAQPSEADHADAARAAEILRATGPLDIGQGCVVAQGLCLGFETVQGTDAMLEYVARTDGRPDPLGARGVLMKARKPGQDTRLDTPTVGPDTVAMANRAGLAGIVMQAGGVNLVDREATIAAADAAGLFLWGRAE
ncbi:hypothetical protein FHS89_000728 [Rubricella aquisinus]|uniref:LpxI family protein n=1 Tax=Rubricella aquisinus TaxID=2028108 RepID=A0A840WM40_9RHOB|nr:UDP-2,3-diacylglucosamine diphosphatase LpxI [Rubricella aquisinus]MBB5514722.1 hypothetical protein [Rubricella aquisinus]